jgi:ABC-type Mn2+/Zn2+ transport system ATPase subunit
MSYGYGRDDGVDPGTSIASIIKPTQQNKKTIRLTSHKLKQQKQNTKPKCNLNQLKGKNTQPQSIKKNNHLTFNRK